MPVSWMVILEHLGLLEQYQVFPKYGSHYLNNAASFYTVNCCFFWSLVLVMSRGSIFILCSAFSAKLIISRCSECQPNCCLVDKGTNVGFIFAGSNTSHVRSLLYVCL